MRRIVATLAVVGALMFSAGAAWADIEDGKRAYWRGDFATAVQEFRPLAEQGDADAQFRLGVLYYEGEGVPQNDAEAIKWYRKAAEQGLAKAQHNLGYMYGEGVGVPQNYVEAVKWWRKAAEQGFADSQHNLGFMYSNGHGVPENDVEALKWYSLAKAKGNDAAATNLAIIQKEMSRAQIDAAQRLAAKWWEEHNN